MTRPRGPSTLIAAAQPPNSATPSTYELRNPGGTTWSTPTRRAGSSLTAWIAKEELRRLLACARPGGHRHEISHRLHRFNTWCADSKLPELERLAGTIEAWWPEVEGFLRTGITNAGTEATNRTVKTAARTAYGFRDLDNQRRRVRFACTRRRRRVTVC